MDLTCKAKKSYSTLLIFLIFCIGLSGFAQNTKNIITIEASVFDKDTQEPLPFTNVIIENTSIGTVSNEEGVFELSFNQKYANGVVIFSFVGYKNASIPIKEFDDPKKIVYLESISTSLDEILVTVKNKYKELVVDAIAQSTTNYASIPVYLQTYYRELTKIDNHYTKFTDAACSIKYGAYDNSFDFRQSKVNYMQFKRLEYEIKKVPFPEPRDLLADEKDYVKIRALRKSDNLQDYKILEEAKALEAIDSTNLKWVENNEIGGGPLRLTGADKIKRQTDFFDPKLVDKYMFKNAGKSTYNNRVVYIISFAPKDASDRQAKYKGTLTIDEKSKAVISYRYQLTNQAKKRSNQKFAAQLKTPESVEKETKLAYITRTTTLLDYEVIISYFEFKGKWYLKRIRVKNDYRNAGDLFDDFSCTTESELVVNSLDFNEPEDLENTDRFYSIFSNSLFNQKISYNPDFWKNYSDLVATGVVGEALQDLESKSTLEEQFKNKK